jgi:probable F420-dependent oxidoreductase
MANPDRTQDLKYGIHLGAANPRLWASIAQEADRLGFNSVWIPEHLIVPLNAAGSPHHGAEHPPIPSDIPIFDAFAVLAFLAAQTERIRLGINVYNIGLRHPFVTARAASTVEMLSGGRLELGIGSSWLREEWDAVGLDFDRRGARVDEAIDVCRRLWSEPVIEHHGEFFDFGPVKFEPKLVQPLDALLQIGGDGAAAFRRAATVGAGWMPMNHKLEDLGSPLARIDEIRERIGRTTPLEITMPGEINSPADVERYLQAGVTRVLVRPWRRSSEALDGLRAFAADYLKPTADAASGA